MTISSDVVILTRAEFEAAKMESFQKGVARGRFEERCELGKANQGADGEKSDGILTGGLAKDVAEAAQRVAEWKLSDDAKARIAEIDNNIRNAMLNADNIVAGRASDPADVAVEPDDRMSIRVALAFADTPRRHSTLQAPADTMDELYEALAVLAKEYRALLDAYGMWRR